jgi:Tfp pilus assembly protein PilX
MLSRETLRRQEGSALITALMVILVMLPIGMALLAIVDTQARNSDSERTRDRAFNLADSALTSASFDLARFGWPATRASAPSNTSTPPAAGVTCGAATYGATLGAATTPGSATAKLQPNLNASYDDSAYTGATWQINVCDDDPFAAGPMVWKDALLGRDPYDANDNQLVWVRSEATVGGHRRVLAALVRVLQTAALSSKYGLVAGRMNSELTTSVTYALTSGVLGNILDLVLGTQPLVAADLGMAPTTPASTGVTAVRCGVLDGCLTGTLGSLGSLSAFNTLVTDGKIVQATSKMATSPASIAQLKQQAINSGTYVASTDGTTSWSNPPACAIPAGANASTVVYIENVGTSGTAGTDGGPGDQFCLLDVSGGKAFKALVIGSGRVVLRGNDTNNGGTFRGLVYALNQQRETLGDDATPTREVIRIDKGAHVRGGVAADGKSAQVGVYPPTATCLLGIAALCPVSILSMLSGYNPAIQADVQLMDNVKIYDSTMLVAGSYRDIAGEAP